MDRSRAQVSAPARRRVAVLGASGLVGRTMLEILEQRDFPVDEPRLLGSGRTRDETIPFRGRALPVDAVSENAFRDIEVALFACENEIARHWAPVAQATGARVVDNSSAFRYDDAVPLVVPEINGARLDDQPTLVANPNCTTIAITMALAPLARAAKLVRVSAATYQAVSGAGRDALAALEAGIREGLDRAPGPRADGGPPFAFNVIPHIDRFESNGYTREEMKVIWETRKILGLPDLPVHATAVRVPVRVGHSAAITATFDRDVTPEEARALWAAFPGLVVVDDPDHALVPTPLAVAGRDEVLVGRARRDLSQAHTLAFFACSDNLRKGAALNAVQIAERLCASGRAR